MDRFKGLLKRFENQKNEELFPICTTQIVELYGSKPQDFNFIIFDCLKSFVINKNTYKRLISAALFEKIINKVFESGDISQYLIFNELLDFDPETFILELEHIKRKKKTKNVLEYKDILSIDLIELSQEQVRVFLTRRNNFLYSKSSKKLESNEKGCKKISKEDEDRFLNEINEKGEDIDELFGKKEKETNDMEEITGEKLKKLKTDMLEKIGKEEIFENYIFVIDLIFELCKFLIFHHNWELRHGALLIFRSIARNFDKMISFQKLMNLGIISKKEKIQKLDISLISGENLKKVQFEINEEIKQKCLILLSLDRFSDFMSDKSNMTNRALAVEVLIITFSNFSNFEKYFYLNEILFIQNVKSGWEPKQAFIFLSKKLIEKNFPIESDNFQIEQEKSLDLISVKQIELIVNQVKKVMLEHEEITEISAEFFTELCLRKKNMLKSKDLESIQNKFIESLNLTEDISYLPKSVFEFFCVLLDIKRLSNSVVAKLDIFIKKFLFHNNQDVRKIIFIFIKKFFQELSLKKIEYVEVDDVKKKFFFFTILFYYLVEKENNENLEISVIIVNILNSIEQEEEKINSLKILLRIFNHKDLSKNIEEINSGFFYNIEKGKKIDFLETFKLAVDIFSQLDSLFLKRFFTIIFEENNNSLIFIIFLLLKDKDKINYDFHPIEADLFKNSEENLVNNFFDEKIKKAEEKCKSYFKENLQDLAKLNIPDLETNFLKILNFIDTQNMKANILEIYNSFVQIFKILKDSIKNQKLDLAYSKSTVEIKNSILPIFEELHKFSMFYSTLIKCVAAGVSMKKYIETKTLPENKMINFFVKPFLELFKMDLNEFWKFELGNMFARLVRIYLNQALHPNTKILLNIFKKAQEESVFRNNVFFYFQNFFFIYKEKVFEVFPIFEEVFTKPFFILEYYKIFLEYPNKFDEAKNLYLQKLISAFQSGILNNPNYFCVIKDLFRELHLNFNINNYQNMDKFLCYFSSLIKKRSELGFKLLLVLIQENKTDFLLYAKFFLIDIIKAINENLKFEKDVIFECFTAILTLSYIEVENEAILKLDPFLVENYKNGRTFLYEFKNNQNFAMNLNGVLNFLPDFHIREYQQEGIKWINFLFKYGLSGALCDDMGLGKTIQSLCALGLIYSKNLIIEKKMENINNVNKWLFDEEKVENDSLVVCPNSLLYHWEKECVKYINPTLISPIILTKNILEEHQNNLDLIKTKQGIQRAVFIITYSTIIKKEDIINQKKFEVIILDEAHMIKNPKNKLSVVMKNLNSRLRLALTGTPIQNNIAELWSIFDFLMPFYLGNSTNFRTKFRALLDLHLISLDTNKMELSNNQEKILKDLHVKVLPFIMRREKNQVLKDLPPKIILDFEAEMTDIQRGVYDLFEKEDIASLGHENFEMEKKPEIKHSFLRVISNLRKIMNHPYLLIQKSKKNHVLSKYQQIYSEALEKMTNLTKLKKDFYASGKFKALKSLLNSLDYQEDDILSCIENSKKILLFTRCTKTLEMIQKFLKTNFKHLSFLSLLQEHCSLERNNIVERFNHDKSYKLLLLTPKIGGLGLNLASAEIVIMFDHDFNPMNDLQAMDRAHRLGQKKVVNVFRIITRDTLEEKIMGIQKFKLSVANTVINYENSSIDNVKKSKFIDFLESFATDNIKKEEEKPLMSNLGVYAKYLKESQIDDCWDEDEYEKEYV